MFFLQRKKQNPKWHPEDKWAEQTPDRMQFITQLQTHGLSEMVTAIIVLTHLNHDISHYCGDYSASINHKGLIFLTGLLARELRQDIMPCTAILQCSCQSVLMAVTPARDVPKSRQTRTLLLQWAPCGQAQKPLRSCPGCYQNDLMQSHGLAVPQALGSSWQCLFGLQCSPCNPGIALGSLLHLLARKVSGTVQFQPAGGNQSCVCKPLTELFCYCSSITK